jgi:hypothetical protein
MYIVQNSGQAVVVNCKGQCGDAVEHTAVRNAKCKTLLIYTTINTDWLCLLFFVYYTVYEKKGNLKYINFTK